MFLTFLTFSHQIIASASAMAEYWIEWYFLPGEDREEKKISYLTLSFSEMKQQSIIMWVGFSISILGMLLRLLGMWTARASFTHLVKEV
jgi:protein-S-isoprenylcysteine O-methyltransferase Ste14